MVAHDARAQFSEHDFRPEHRPQRGRDRGARDGDVEQAAGERCVVAHMQDGEAVGRGDALVATLVRPFEFGPVGEPHQLRDELLALVLGGEDAKREAAVNGARNRAFEHPDLLE